MSLYANKEEIEKIANLIAAVVPNCCGVTLGGSRAHGLNDEISDVEMYFYSTSGIPSLEDLNKCLYSIDAKHKRYPEFLWNEYPWGPHSFFEVFGLYFEIGFRIVSDIQEKVQKYLAGNVAPTTDCHDLGLGYMYSGLAASVCSEKVILSFDGEIERLKGMSAEFSEELLEALKAEYLETASSLVNGKLHNAALRNDVFFYEVMSSRIVRSLMVMAFAISRKHFPGDKWNAPLLLRTEWDKASEFIDILYSHISMDSTKNSNLLNKWKLMMTAYNLIEGELQ